MNKNQRCFQRKPIIVQNTFDITGRFILVQLVFFQHPCFQRSLGSFLFLADNIFRARWILGDEISGCPGTFILVELQTNSLRDLPQFGSVSFFQGYIHLKQREQKLLQKEFHVVNREESNKITSNTTLRKCCSILAVA